MKRCSKNISLQNVTSVLHQIPLRFSGQQKAVQLSHRYIWRAPDRPAAGITEGRLVAAKALLASVASGNVSTSRCFGDASSPFSLE